MKTFVFIIQFMADRTSAHNAPIHDLASKTMLELANPRVPWPGSADAF